MKITSQEEIREEITALAEKNSWWSTFVGSQFIAMLSTYLSQLCYRCYQFAASALAEGFISTAANRSSILAAAEDRGYIGDRPSPSTGKAKISNISSILVSVPQYSSFISDDELPYLAMEYLDLKAGESATISVAQMEIVTVRQTISTAKQFMELPLSKDLTAVCHKIDVIVTEGGKDTVWTETKAFRLASDTSNCYVLFYNSNDQIGVRFGDGTIGRIPPVDSTVKLRVWCTNGDTTLLAGQTLTPSDNSAYLGDVIAAETATSITGGTIAEEIEITRQRAKYQTAYDDQVAWGGDYTFYLKRNVPGTSWFKAWGEAEQEKIIGARDFNFINKIFISGYHPLYNQEELEALVLGALSKIPNELNKRFQYVPINELPFMITVTGTISASLTTAAVVSSLKTSLDARFGQNANFFDPTSVGEYRLIKKKDLWAFIESLNYFEDFSLEYSDWHESNGYFDFVYLDITDSIFNISFEE